MIKARGQITIVDLNDGKGADNITISASCHDGENNNYELCYLGINGKRITTSSTIVQYVWKNGEYVQGSISSGNIPQTRGLFFYYINANTLEVIQIHIFDNYSLTEESCNKISVWIKNVKKWFEDNVNYPIILAMIANDASSCPQSLRDILKEWGGLESGTYLNQRRRHYFVTNINPTAGAGQGYEEISEDPTQKVITIPVVQGVGIVLNGIKGNEGQSGADGTIIVGEAARHFLSREAFIAFSQKVIGETYLIDEDEEDNNVSAIMTWNGEYPDIWDWAKGNNAYINKEDGHLYISQSDRPWKDAGRYVGKKGDDGTSPVVATLDVTSATFNIDGSSMLSNPELVITPKLLIGEKEAFIQYITFRSDCQDIYIAPDGLEIIEDIVNYNINCSFNGKIHINYYDNYESYLYGDWLHNVGEKARHPTVYCLVRGIFEGKYYQATTALSLNALQIAQDGRPGTTGKQGKQTRPRGEWNKDDLYVNNDTYRDIIIYNGLTYAVKEGKTEVPLNTPPPNTTYWEAANEFKFVATDLLMSEAIYAKVLQAVNARIDDLILNNAYAYKKNEDGTFDLDNPTVQILGDSGSLIVNNGIFKGTLSAKVIRNEHRFVETDGFDLENDPAAIYNTNVRNYKYFTLQLPSDLKYEGVELSFYNRGITRGGGTVSTLKGDFHQGGDYYNTIANYEFVTLFGILHNAGLVWLVKHITGGTPTFE